MNPQKSGGSMLRTAIAVSVCLAVPILILFVAPRGIKHLRGLFKKRKKEREHRNSLERAVRNGAAQ